jgi:hypothetical protein
VLDALEVGEAVTTAYDAYSTAKDVRSAASEYNQWQREQQMQQQQQYYQMQQQQQQYYRQGW